jgi:Cu/Zn superoxide dismutase
MLLLFFSDEGDLGTLQSGKDGAMDAWKNETHLTLFGEYSILGRSIMVYIIIFINSTL